MLTCENAILIAIEAAGSIGRTALQKLIFFAKQQGLTDVSYHPHYYGPYSREVASTLLNLVAAGWVQESCESWPDGSVFGERRRYSYRLSETGKAALQSLVGQHCPEVKKLQELVRICRQKTGLDFHTLSLAAKTCFLRTALGKALTPEEIEQQARSWGWQVKKDEVPKVADLLDALQLGQPAS